MVAIPLNLTESINNELAISDKPRTQERQMSQDRVSGLLAAYFTQPYVEYGEVVLEIRNEGGLTSDEVQLIQNQLLRIDANTIIRHAGTAESEV